MNSGIDEVYDDVYIANITEARTTSKEDMDAVVTVCQDSIEDNVGCEYYYFNMADGPHCGYGGDYSYEIFEESARTVLQLIIDDKTVIVHCHAGQSRSASVTIAALAVFNDWSYDEAYNHVERKRPQIHPDGLLVKHAIRFIENAK